MKLTATQELIEQMHPNFFTEQEKKFWIEKEKQQIIDAYEKDMSSNGILSFESGEQYYNQTYIDNENRNG